MMNEISCYVTSRGGVVVLNGPFPVEKANAIASLCDAAPDLLEAAKMAFEDLEEHEWTGIDGDYAVTATVKALRAAIAKAEGREATQAQTKEGE